MSEGRAPRKSKSPRRSARTPTPKGGARDETRVSAPVDGVVLQKLAQAGADVVASWQRAEQGPLSPVDLHAAVGVLAHAVDQVCRGEVPDLAALPRFVPVRRVLERMRSALLQHADRDADLARSRDYLRVVRAMECVQVALDQDAAHRFISRLSGHDAQQLVVEMAHDMRSPLGSILILAERLRAGAGGELPALQKRQLGLIYSAAFGLSSLAGDVIELARGGTTLVDTQPGPFNVSDVLQSIADILRPMAEEKRLELSWTGPTANLRVGHASALNRVLLNLATNAIKFTNAGSVRLACKELDRVRVEFSVVDTGRGIPEHVMAHLFEAFRQRQLPGDYAFSSAGLGLSICQKLVGAMGSELRVETALEQGTRFSFTLSLRQPERL